MRLGDDKGYTETQRKQKRKGFCATDTREGYSRNKAIKKDALFQEGGAQEEDGKSV